MTWKVIVLANDKISHLISLLPKFPDVALVGVTPVGPLMQRAYLQGNENEMRELLSIVDPQIKRKNGKV